jgi:undecaprenyl-phosphate 4-deoxy-4-formamido-L-arabinose transferase
MSCLTDRPETDLSIIIAVYNSQDCLSALLSEIRKALHSTGWSYEVILVNDCSPDQSWQMIETLCREDSRVLGIDLRRNFGQDNAILTGIRYSRGRCVAIMDDDLQHHPQDLPALVRKLEEGADVVYADFRKKHQKWWKNIGSWFNGKVAEWVIDKPPGVYLSPFKVLRKDVARLISAYDGPDPYVDGLLFQVTSRMAHIITDHHPRYSGTSNYSMVKSIQVWSRLAFSFSIRPLRLVAWFGLGAAFMGVFLAAAVVAYRLLFPQEFSSQGAGWASLMAAMLFLGGMQMLFVGILGEYAGRTYLRVNGKPLAAVREILNDSPCRNSVANGVLKQSAGEPRRGSQLSL